MISKIINHSIDRKVINNYFDDRQSLSGLAFGLLVEQNFTFFSIVFYVSQTRRFIY